MQNNTPEQFLTVFMRLSMREDLSIEAKQLFLDALARIIRKKISLPIARLPLTLQTSLNAAKTALSELRSAKLAKPIQKTDGIHVAINPNADVFLPEKSTPTKATLENFVQGVFKQAKTGDLVAAWRALYFKQFGEFPKPDPQQLVQFKLLARTRSGDELLDAMQNFVFKSRTNRDLCTTKRFYGTLSRKQAK